MKVISIGLWLAGFEKILETCYSTFPMGKICKGNSDRLTTCKFQEKLMTSENHINIEMNGLKTNSTCFRDLYST